MAGPVVTVNGLISDVRLHTRDTNTTSPGLSEANIVSLLNRAYYDYCSIMDGDETLFASASGTLTSGTNSASVSFSTCPLNVEAVYLTGLAKLKKAPLHELLMVQAEEPDRSGDPQFYAVDFAGSRDSATVRFDSKPTSTYTVVLWYRKEPAALAAGTNTIPLGDHAAYTISMMAAVSGANILGRPADFISRLSNQIPESIRSHLGVTFRSGTKGGTSSRREP